MRPLNIYWTSTIDGTARMVAAPSANIARRKLPTADLIAFPVLAVAITGLERCVEEYARHHYPNTGHVLDLSGIS